MSVEEDRFLSWLIVLALEQETRRSPRASASSRSCEVFRDQGSHGLVLDRQTNSYLSSLLRLFEREGDESEDCPTLQLLHTCWSGSHVFVAKDDFGRSRLNSRFAVDVDLAVSPTTGAFFARAPFCFPFFVVDLDDLGTDLRLVFRLRVVFGRDAPGFFPRASIDGLRTSPEQCHLALLFVARSEALRREEESDDHIY